MLNSQMVQRGFFPNHLIPKQELEPVSVVLHLLEGTFKYVLYVLPTELKWRHVFSHINNKQDQT